MRAHILGSGKFFVSVRPFIRTAPLFAGLTGVCRLERKVKNFPLQVIVDSKRQNSSVVYLSKGMCAVLRFSRILSLIIISIIITIGNGLFYGNGFIVPFIGKYFADNDEHFVYGIEGNFPVNQDQIMFKKFTKSLHNIMESDIIFVGASRMQFGFNIDMVKSYFSHENIKSYNLSIVGQSYKLYNDYFKRHPVIDKVVLIDIDAVFLGDAEFIEDKSTVFDFLLSQTSARILNFSEGILPALIYKDLDVFGINPSKFTIFKNFTNGFYDTKNLAEFIKTSTKKECSATSKQLVDQFTSSGIMELIEELRNNGCLVILTEVPYPEASPLDVIEIGRIYNLPVIIFDKPYESLHVFDGSHLDIESATKFTSFLLPRIVEFFKYFQKTHQGPTFQRQSAILQDEAKEAFSAGNFVNACGMASEAANLYVGDHLLIERNEYCEMKNRIESLVKQGENELKALQLDNAQRTFEEVKKIYVNARTNLESEIDDVRRQSLWAINQALEKYFSEKGFYPPGIGPEGNFSRDGQFKEDWITGLAPEYIDKLPRDPRNRKSMNDQYVYWSDGKDYKLISNGAEDCEFVKKINPQIIDPVRDCFAYGYWTPNAAKW
ncbi:MAG: hypothetical protein HQK82_11065 [Desulfovibrionaceae bacterium]|nr:hypothetical protein [Desulfovibrionaceae bacterium]